MMIAWIYDMGRDLHNISVNLHNIWINLPNYYTFCTIIVKIFKCSKKLLICIDIMHQLWLKQELWSFSGNIAAQFALFFYKIYTTDNNFTRPPVASVAPNINSASMVILSLVEINPQVLCSWTRWWTISGWWFNRMKQTLKYKNCQTLWWRLWNCSFLVLSARWNQCISKVGICAEYVNKVEQSEGWLEA